MSVEVVVLGIFIVSGTVAALLLPLFLLLLAFLLLLSLVSSRPYYCNSRLC
jgi:hypothetical protein